MTVLSAMTDKFLSTQFEKQKMRLADVGAHGGIVEHWRPYLKFMAVDAFEPNKQDCLKQQAKSELEISWFPIGLAETTGQHKLYVLNRETGSSLYPPNIPVMSQYCGEDYYGLKKVLDIECTSVSDFLKEHRRSPYHVIKLDTQGAELGILRGVGEFVSSLLVVEAEVEFQELYKGQPLFNEVDQFMKDQGFDLWDLRTHRSYLHEAGSPLIKKELGFAYGNHKLSAQLIAGDALYFKKFDLVGEELIRPMLLASLIYKAFDRFYAGLAVAESKRFLSSQELEGWERVGKKLAPSPWPWQRAILLRKIIGKMNSLLGTRFINQQPVFWTWRSWPDQ